MLPVAQRPTTHALAHRASLNWIVLALLVLVSRPTMKHTCSPLRLSQ